LFLSSGTWSLLGIELRRPVTTAAARAAGFSNEQGLEGRTRFLTNIAGMWLLQECRRVWAGQCQVIEYGAMVDMAADTLVVKYGEPIGSATAAIPAGAHVHVHNLRSRRARGDARPGATAG
jgi:hypothetical protein